MQYSHIVEGATLVHEIDRAGRAALYKKLDAYMEMLWKPFNPNGYNENDPDEHHNDYDRFYQHYREDENAKALVVQICMVASATLTDIVHTDLHKRYGEYVSFDREGWEDGKKKIYKKGVRVEIDSVRVNITVQPTEGRHATAGGYFTPFLHQSSITVHVKSEEIITAAMAAVQSIAFGESEDRDALVNSIAPTFAHEYSHLLQYIGAGSYNAFKSGITTVGGKNAPRQGDRTETGWWRYMGSYAEIDSFASSAASTMIATKDSRTWNQTADNEEINYSMQDAASGYTSDDSYDIYIRKYQEALADEYADIGLNKEEAVKVWKRFLKTLYAKLDAYKRAQHGKDTSGYHTGNAKPQWVEWAKKGISFCAARMADDIAQQCADTSYKGYDDEWRIEPNDPFQKATSFLEGYFLKDNYDFEKSMKIVNAFKNLVVTRIPMYQKKMAA
jgi:hypothetical protein